ncbi:MAG: hypothetical protein WAW88_07430 [Nocardioides sp.]
MKPRNFAGLLTVGMLALGALTQPASAAEPPMQHTHDVVSYADSLNVCGIDVDVKFHWIANEFLRRTASGAVYHSLNVRETNVYTNPESGKTFTQFSTYRNQDMKYSDNGDGTTTVTVKAVGPTRLSGDNGVFFMDTSVLVFTYLIDTATGEWIADGDLVRNVGLHEDRDLCAGVEAALL